MSVQADKHKLIQVELRCHGFYTGIIDGVWGPKTQTAYNQYKNYNTSPQYLNLHASKEPLWNMHHVPDGFITAWNERTKRVREFPGNLHNEDIIKYGTAVDAQILADEIPWCSSFVNWCLEENGQTTTRSALARSWLKWGQSVKALWNLPLGAIVVFKRGTSKIYGHVGFLVCYERELQRIHVLGGNQRNEINISAYSDEDLLDFRWSK